MRVHHILRGVHLDGLITELEYKNFVNFASLHLNEIQAEFALPKFSKLLTRHENISKGVHGEGAGRREKIEGLPAPVNQERLSKSQALTAQYTVYKIIYEDLFREWVAKLSAEEINTIAKIAIQRTVDAARTMNGKKRR